MIKHVWHDVLIWALGNATCIGNLHSYSHKASGLMSKSNLQWAGQLELVRRCIWLYLLWIWPLALGWKDVAQSFTKYRLVGPNTASHIDQKNAAIRNRETEQNLLTLHSCSQEARGTQSPHTGRHAWYSAPGRNLEVSHLLKLIVKEEGKNRKTSKERDWRSGAICPFGKGQINLYNYAPQLS